MNLADVFWLALGIGIGVVMTAVLMRRTPEEMRILDEYYELALGGDGPAPGRESPKTG